MALGAYRAAVVHRFREPLAIEQVAGDDLAPGQVRVEVDASGLYGWLRRGGTLVFVGLPADNQVQLPIFETVLGGIRPLDTVNVAMADVEAGRVAARLVFDL